MALINGSSKQVEFAKHIVACDQSSTVKSPVKYKNFDVQRKKEIIKTVIECGKRCSNIFIWVKKDLFGCFRERKRDKANEIGLKEGG